MTQIVEVTLCLRLGEPEPLQDIPGLLENIMDAIERQAFNSGLTSSHEEENWVSEFWAGVGGTTEYDTVPIQLYSPPSKMMRRTPMTDSEKLYEEMGLSSCESRTLVLSSLPASLIDQAEAIGSWVSFFDGDSGAIIDLNDVPVDLPKGTNPMLVKIIERAVADGYGYLIMFG
jgi:hypothetical protein